MAVGRTNTHTHRRSARERGQALLEFALVVPIFLVLVFGIIDFGWALRSWITVTNAAREGARIGAVHAAAGTVGECSVASGDAPVGGMPTIAARACKTADTLDTNSTAVAIDGADLDGPAGPVGAGLTGNSVTVTLTYRHDFLTPLGSLIGSFTKQDCAGVEADLCIRSATGVRME